MSVAEPLIQATLIGEAVDNGPFAIFVTDDNGCYVAVNTFACDLLGYTRGELLSLTADALAPDQAVTAHGRHLSGTSVLRHKDGRDVTIEWRASRTIVAGMEFFVSFATPS